MSTTVAAFARRFEHIAHERIEGMPIYNPLLEVEPIDFQPCEQGQIGVLITQWFINIILLPEDTTPWRTSELGSKHLLTLAGREQKFVLGEEDVLGHYLFRTVVSPTLAFKTQDAARDQARRALQELLAEEEPGEQAPSSLQAELSAEIKKDMGRREFMRKLVPSSG